MGNRAWHVFASIALLAGILAAPAGAASFRSGSTLPTGDRPYRLASADFNADGLADLAVVNFGGNSLSIFLGDGLGGFAPAPGSPYATSNGPTSVATGDVTGDGRPD